MVDAVKLETLLDDARDLSYNNFTGGIPFNIGFLQVATLYVLLSTSSFVSTYFKLHLIHDVK